MHERGIELDRTIFYPQGGGQMGDTGVLVRENGERIALRTPARAMRSTACCTSRNRTCRNPKSAKHSTLDIDWARRYSMMRLHTALHVMSCVVVAPVTGGNISPDKGRLDFDIDMSLLDAARIEQRDERVDRARHRHRNGLDYRRGARCAARSSSRR